MYRERVRLRLVEMDRVLLAVMDVEGVKDAVEVVERVLVRDESKDGVCCTMNMPVGICGRVKPVQPHDSRFPQAEGMQ